MWWTAAQACEALGVQRRTLYTYASRGWVRRRRTGGRSCLYLAADVRDLVRRAEEARGRGPAAGAALRWGPAVLPSALTAIDPDGPYYRGVSAASLVADGAGLEAAADRLWQQPLRMQAPPRPPSKAGDLVDTLAGALLGVDDGDAPAALVGALTVAVAVAFEGDVAAATVAPTVAHGLAAAFRAPDDHLADLDAALVWCADHELNPSTFAARVAAATGARLDRCLLAALAAWSGPRHGGASDALEHALDHGEHASIGFGHPLYPLGDPRGDALVQRAGGLPDGWPALDGPNLDAGLVALRRARGWPRGSAAALFAVGRSVGWIAHALEQRTQGPLRPRAHYTGPEPWR